MHDGLSPNGVCSGSRDLFKVWQISDNIPETYKLDIVTTSGFAARPARRTAGPSSARLLYMLLLQAEYPSPDTHQCHALQPAVVCTVLSLMFKLGLRSVTVTKRTAEFESVFDINCNQIGALSLYLCTFSDSCHSEPEKNVAVYF